MLLLLLLLVAVAAAFFAVVSVVAIPGRNASCHLCISTLLFVVVAGTAAVGKSQSLDCSGICLSRLFLGNFWRALRKKMKNGSHS